MRIRSWIAAPAMMMGMGLVLALAGTTAAGPDNGDDKVVPLTNKVNLEISISGLSAQGAKIEIKPAHPNCQFNVVGITIPKGDRGEVVKIDPFAVKATTTSPDRDCSFEIVVTEPGQKPKTFRRGLQLANPSADAPKNTPLSTLKCYLPATTLASKDDGKNRKIR